MVFCHCMYLCWMWPWCFVIVCIYAECDHGVLSFVCIYAECDHGVLSFVCIYYACDHSVLLVHVIIKSTTLNLIDIQLIQSLTMSQLTEQMKSQHKLIAAIMWWLLDLLSLWPLSHHLLTARVELNWSIWGPSMSILMRPSSVSPPRAQRQSCFILFMWEAPFTHSCWQWIHVCNMN